MRAALDAAPSLPAPHPASGHLLPVKNGKKEKHTFSEPMTEQANGIVGDWF